jgi:Gpi18-like mannosyltransferase
MQTQEPILATPEQSEIPPVTTASQAWRDIVQPWWQATLAILPIFLLTRFVLLLLSYFGGVLFFVPNYWAGQLAFRDVLYTWYHWDAIRFATIATRGYITPEYAAFFPLYPALERSFSLLFHRDILESGMIVSNLALLGTLIVFYRFVEMEFDKDTAKRSVLYLCIFPTAFFFFAAYNESLFLFFMLLCFYCMRRGSWWLAGLFGGLATLTRSIGLFLCIIYLCEFLRQQWPHLRSVVGARFIAPVSATNHVSEESTSNNGRDKSGPYVVVRVLADLSPIVFIPLGLGVYAYGLSVRFNDPLAFQHAQANWREGLSFPWVGPLVAIKSIWHLSPYTFAIPHDIIELTALSLFLTLLILGMFGPERIARHQWTFLLFGFMALIFALLFPGTPGANNLPYDPMPSMQRLVLEVFVGFIMLARFGRRPWFHQTYLLISLPMMTFLVFQFLTGHWTV